MDDVTWRPVPGPNTYHEASSDGEIRTVDRYYDNRWGGKTFIAGRVIKLYQNKTGYLQATYNFKGKSCLISAHAFICAAFHGERPSELHEVRHLNGIRTDNRAENLTWGTRSENTNDSVRHGTHHMARRAYCPQGHPYDDENTTTFGKSRGCKSCIADRKRRVRLENRLADKPDDPRHGTTTGRFTYGCECDRCKAAARPVWQRQNERNKRSA